MRKYLVFYPVDNGLGLGRHAFDAMTDEEAWKKLDEVEGVRVYDLTRSDRNGQMLDMGDFVEDYNDEELDGGWWSIVLTPPEEEEERKLIGYQVLDVNADIPDGLFSFQVFRAEQDAKDYINETGNKGNIVPIFDGDIEEPSFLGKKPRTFKQGERVVVCTDYGNYQAVVVHDMYVDYEDDLIKIHVLRNEEDDDSSGISTESIEASDVYQYANGKVCPRCGGPLCIEHHDEIDYPYFCPSCDENFYGIEVQ